MEPLVDTVLECIRSQLDERFAGTEQVFDMGNWLQYFAFDVMGSITFSKRYGFLDQGRDVNGMLGTIVDFMRAAAPVSDLALLYRSVAISLSTKTDDTNLLLGQNTAKECGC